VKQTLVKNIGCLAGILPEGTERLCGKQMAILNTIENAWLLIEDGRIKDFGEAPFPCPQEVEASETAVIDAKGGTVMRQPHPHRLCRQPRAGVR